MTISLRKKRKYKGKRKEYPGWYGAYQPVAGDVPERAYKLFPSVVRAVPNCGRSRTKVRYKAYQPLVFPVPNAGIICTYIVLI